MPFQERFPQYYKYFSTESFVYHGETMRNHNHLLGAVEGTDGIKTGYTRASGFNLVASVHRDGRRIVAVILGGKSSFERDVRQESSRRKGGRMPPMRWRDQGATRPGLKENGRDPISDQTLEAQRRQRQARQGAIGSCD